MDGYPETSVSDSRCFKNRCQDSRQTNFIIIILFECYAAKPFFVLLVYSVKLETFMFLITKNTLHNNILSCFKRVVLSTIMLMQPERYGTILFYPVLYYPFPLDWGILYVCLITADDQLNQTKRLSAKKCFIFFD